jgi:hypothetical protein
MKQCHHIPRRSQRMLGEASDTANPPELGSPLAPILRLAADLVETTSALTPPLCLALYQLARREPPPRLLPHPDLRAPELTGGATAWEEEGVEVEAPTCDGRAREQEAEDGGGGGGSGGHGARQRSRGEECEGAE